MEGAAGSPAATSGGDGDSPLFLENVAHNAKSIQYIKSTASCIAGAAAGVLGLTDWSGLLFYLFIGLVIVPASITASKGDRGSLSKFTSSRADVWLGGVVEHAFSYMLWWTLFYGLVHIYE